MVKNKVCIASWVTSQASVVLINISVFAIVLLVGFRIFVANGAGEFCKIGGIGMTFGAFHPFPLVFPAINGEILRIVAGELSRHPVRVCSVAHGAIIREIGADVIRRLGVFKILLVASKAIIRRIGEVSTNVALLTIYLIMSIGQGEKIVVHFFSGPFSFKNIVAFQTICRKTRLLVVGVGAGHKILSVATDAIISDPIEL